MNDSKECSIVSAINDIILGIQWFSDLMNAAQNWLRNNADTILAYIDVFSSFKIWCEAVEKLKKAQVVFTDDLRPELANQIYESEDVDTIVQNYYFGNNNHNFNVLIERCRQSEYVKMFDAFFSEILASYEMGHYRLACVGLFSLLDGILSDASNMMDETNFKKRICTILKKIEAIDELSDLDMRLLCIYLSVNSFEDTLFFNSSFKAPEPEKLNRHWAIHGRSHRIFSKYDFLKELLWLNAIIIMANPPEQQNYIEMEQ